MMTSVYLHETAIQTESVLCPDKSSLLTLTMGIRPSSLRPDITTDPSFVSCDTDDVQEERRDT